MEAAGDKPPAVSTWDELRAAGWKLVTPPYPYTARSKQETGAGEVTLATDATGKVVEARMTKKIGYPELDDFVVQFAQQQWHGPPRTRATARIEFCLP